MATTTTSAEAPTAQVGTETWDQERAARKDTREGWLFCAPYLVLFVVFVIFPAVWGLWISLHRYDFTLPKKARTSVTVFIPTIGGSCDNGNPDQPTIGLYIDNVAIAGTAATVPAGASDRSVLLTATLPLTGSAHTGRVGISCGGASAPNVAAPGAKSWTIIQAD